MSQSQVKIHVMGKPMWVPSACVEGRTVISAGKMLKVAAVMDEELVEGETVADPEAFVSQVKHTELNADIFTFAQKLPEVVPKYKYRTEWDSAAVIPITSYSEWFEKRAEYDVRKAVKRANRLGVVVRLAEFDDAFVEGVCRIYNESPTRQGRAFWHYQKSFNDVKDESATYSERSVFIGAYYNEELIGFVKMVRVGPIARTLHVISEKKHFDKKPTNALIAKTVEICELSGLSHLVYGTYASGDPKNSLTEFKRRNGFEEVLVPRYHIPLTLKGRIALRWNLHRQMAARLPEGVTTQLRRVRGLWYGRKARSSGEMTERRRA